MSYEGCMPTASLDRTQKNPFPRARRPGVPLGRAAEGFLRFCTPFSLLSAHHVRWNETQLGGTVQDRGPHLLPTSLFYGRENGGLRQRKCLPKARY